MVDCIIRGIGRISKQLVEENLTFLKKYDPSFDDIETYLNTEIILIAEKEMEACLVQELSRAGNTSELGEIINGGSSNICQVKLYSGFVTKILPIALKDQLGQKLPDVDRSRIDQLVDDFTRKFLCGDGNIPLSSKEKEELLKKNAEIVKIRKRKYNRFKYIKGEREFNRKLLCGKLNPKISIDQLKEVDLGVYGLEEKITYWD